MSRRSSAIPATPAELRRLQGRLSELSVPDLLSIREAAAAALERDLLDAADISAVLRAADQRR